MGPSTRVFAPCSGPFAAPWQHTRPRQFVCPSRPQAMSKPLASGASNGCAKRRQGRTIDLIIGIALPVGRSVAKPSIFVPFQYPISAAPTGSPHPSPIEKVRPIIAKVRLWAQHLRAHEVASLGAIAKAEGISVARVSQLLVLDRLSPTDVEAIIKRLKRISVRALIGAARDR
jgi:hypothetical protein